MVFIFGGAHGHRNPNSPGANTCRVKNVIYTSAYNPFRNKVEKAISALKTTVEVDITRAE